MSLRKNFRPAPPGYLYKISKRELKREYRTIGGIPEALLVQSYMPSELITKFVFSHVCANSPTDGPIYLPRYVLTMDCQHDEKQFIKIKINYSKSVGGIVITHELHQGVNQSYIKTEKVVDLYNPDGKEEVRKILVIWMNQCCAIQRSSDETLKFWKPQTFDYGTIMGTIT